MIPLSASAILVLALLYFLYSRILYPAFASPLSKLPAAHPTAHVSDAWIAHRRQTGCESRSIFSAHQRCGPIIRLGPNEISITSYESLRKVYYGGYTRTDWVLPFRNYNSTHNLVTMIDPQKHAVRRRILSNLFSKSHILGSADFAALSQTIIFGRLLLFLDDSSQKQTTVDVFEITRAVAVDLMSAYQVGLQNGLDFTSPGRDAARRVHLDNGSKKLRNLKGVEQASNELEDECFGTCLAADKTLNSGRDLQQTDKGEHAHATLTSTHPVIFAQLRAAIPDKEGAATLNETLRLIASELLDNMEAARVGIGITVTYAMYRLSQQPNLQSQLRSQLLALNRPPQYPLQENLSKPTLYAMDSLALLDAIVMETLRLHASAPGPQYRLVPAGGTILDGYFVPAGTWVSTSPYCLHQNTGAYLDPAAWKPERWMQNRSSGNGEQLSVAAIEENSKEKLAPNDPRRWFWAFGRGSRMCIGSNFSLVGKWCSRICFSLFLLRRKEERKRLQFMRSIKK